MGGEIGRARVVKKTPVTEMLPRVCAVEAANKQMSPMTTSDFSVSKYYRENKLEICVYNNTEKYCLGPFPTVSLFHNGPQKPRPVSRRRGYE